MIKIKLVSDVLRNENTVSKVFKSKNKLCEYEVVKNIDDKSLYVLMWHKNADNKYSSYVIIIDEFYDTKEKLEIGYNKVINHMDIVDKVYMSHLYEEEEDWDENINATAGVLIDTKDILYFKIQYTYETYYINAFLRCKDGSCTAIFKSGYKSECIEVLKKILDGINHNGDESTMIIENRED